MTIATPEYHTLKDGRKMAYRLYGDMQGTPMLFLHGTPGTSHQIAMAAEGAQKHGFKLIAPDRPGLGDSDLQPERQLFHYPLDIAQLLNHLQMESCPLAAISGGSPYALQCAHDLPTRISFLVSLSGWVSYGRPELRHISLDPMLQMMDKLCRHGPLLLPVVGRVANWLVKHRIEKVYEHLLKMLPPADIQLLQNPFYRETLLEDMQHAYRHGWDGVKQETFLQFTHPAFAVSDIHQPTYLLHGTADTIVPYAFSEYLNRELRNVVEFETIPEGGHLCAIGEQDRIFEALRKYLP